MKYFVGIILGFCATVNVAVGQEDARSPSIEVWEAVTKEWNIEDPAYLRIMAALPTIDAHELGNLLEEFSEEMRLSSGAGHSGKMYALKMLYMDLWHLLARLSREKYYTNAMKILNKFAAERRTVSVTDFWAVEAVLSSFSFHHLSRDSLLDLCILACKSSDWLVFERGIRVMLGTMPGLQKAKLKEIYPPLDPGLAVVLLVQRYLDVQDNAVSLLREYDLNGEGLVEILNKDYGHKDIDKASIEALINAMNR